MTQVPGLVVWAILAYNNFATAYEISYMDCKKPLRIHSYNVAKLCAFEDNKTIAKTNYNILVPRKVIKMKGYHCSVKKSTFTMYCGAFSHNKFLEPPTIDVPEHVSIDLCHSLVSSNRYVVPSNGLILHAALGEETISTVDELGTIHTSNNVKCEGEQLKVNGNVVDSVLQLAQYRIKLTREEFVQVGDQVESISQHFKLPKTCGAGTRGCVVSEGTFIWREPENRCLFAVAKENAEFQTEGDHLVNHNEKIRLKLESDTMMSNHCPTGTLWYTNNPNIMLTKTKGYPAMEPTDVDIFTYVQARADYLQYNIEADKVDLQNYIRARVCQSEYANVQHQIAPLQGYNTLRKGDVIYVFSCSKKSGRVVALKQCYNKIPIEGNLFIDPITRIASEHAAATECNQIFPMVVETSSGWISVTNVIKPVKAPETMHREKIASDHESQLHAGIYTPEEEQAWESLVTLGSFKEATVEEISLGVCRQSGKCVLQPGPQYSTYNLQNLVDKVNPVLSITEHMNKWLQSHIGWLCFSVLALWATQMVIAIIIILQTTFVNGVKAGIATFYILLCFVPYNIQRARRNAVRRYEREAAEHRPQVPPYDVAEMEMRDLMTKPTA